MPKLKSCSKCRRRPRRAVDQAYCQQCHARESKAYRAKQREQLEALRAIAKRYGGADAL